MTMIVEAKQLVKQAEAGHKKAGAKKNFELRYRVEVKAKAAKALVDQIK